MPDESAIGLEDACKQVLADNQHDDYTVPAGGIYPHQWLWDSCFISIGLANYDTDRAQKELISLLRGQWSNGMLPNMIFAKGDDRHSDRNLWQSWRSPLSPEKLATSGITQPPMLAEAVRRIGNKLNKADRRSWYLDIYPGLLAYHEWLYRERDPRNEGLVLLVHPWESGLDNSPPWITQMYSHHRPLWIRAIEKTRADKLYSLFRRDTRHIPPGQRVSNIDALLYYDVIRQLRRKNWDIEAILKRTNFAIQDLTFNCILIRAHDHLKVIAKTIGHEVPEWLNDRVKIARSQIDEKLWDAEAGQFYSRDFISHRLIREPSIAALMPLYSGCISKDQAARLVELLKSKKQFGSPYPVASVPLSSDWFKELGYWQGPSWVNTNWLIIDGLKRYGYKEEAEELRLSTIAMVEEKGPYEYFSPKTGEPAGVANFSWTAALIIDLLAD